MTTRLTLKIDGMECPNCAMRLESLEDTLPGILRAEGSYHKAQLKIEYDERVTGEEQIFAAIRKLGYEVAAVTRG